MKLDGRENLGVYSSEIDKVDRNTWTEVLQLFDDASIYQTWSSGIARVGEENLSHLILRKNGEIVGLCQVVIRTVHFLKTGIGDVNKGPLWRKSGREADVEHLIHLLEAVREEYVIKRGLLLRVWPNEVESSGSGMRSLFERLGFKCNSTSPRFRTLRLDLTPPLDELRKNLLQKWRNQLNRAEKDNLRVVEGSEDDLYGIFLKLLREVVKRKEFVPVVDYDQFRAIQNDLEEPLKMKIMVCEEEGEPLGVSICSAIGNTGIYLFGATGDKGMKVNGSNLLQWHMVQWLKRRGVRWYDLGGIDPQNNPGVYHFKCGIAGRSGKDEMFLGEFDAFNSARTYLLHSFILKTGFLREKLKRIAPFATYLQRRGTI
jgi:hypothetical protein